MSLQITSQPSFTPASTVGNEPSVFNERSTEASSTSSPATLTHAGTVGADRTSSQGGTPTSLESPAPGVQSNPGATQTAQDALASAFLDAVMNSSYPDFTTALKEMMAEAQKVKEQATEVKMGSIEAKYQTQLQGVDAMKEAAEKANDSRLKNINAEVKAAWTSFAFSVAGAAVAGAGLRMGSGAAMAMGQLGGSIGGMGQSIGTIGTASDKIAASEDQKKADLLNALKAALDAQATKMDANTELASNLADAVKTLRDHVMSMLGQLNSSHAQIMQKAAEV